MFQSRRAPGSKHRTWDQNNDKTERPLQLLKKTPYFFMRGGVEFFISLRSRGYQPIAIGAFLFYLCRYRAYCRQAILVSCKTA